MATLTSTVDDYVAVARIADSTARRHAWAEQYEAAHPEVFKVYYKHWGKTENRVHAADSAPDLSPVIQDRERRVRRLLDGTEKELRTQGLVEDGIDTVLLVGGHTSNGWVAEFRGRPTLFLALEFLPEPPFDQVLALHEGMHVVHHRLSDLGAWPETIGAALFAEGFAVAATRQLALNLEDTAYLWFDDDHEPWVQRCCTDSKAIRSFALNSFDQPDLNDRSRGLFTQHPLPGNLLPRCGYWLGDQMISRWIADGRTLRDLGLMTANEALSATRDWLETS